MFFLFSRSIRGHFVEAVTKGYLGSNASYKSNVGCGALYRMLFVELVFSAGFCFCKELLKNKMVLKPLCDCVRVLVVSAKKFRKVCNVIVLFVILK